MRRDLPEDLKLALEAFTVIDDRQKHWQMLGNVLKGAANAHSRVAEVEAKCGRIEAEHQARCAGLAKEAEELEIRRDGVAKQIEDLNGGLADARARWHKAQIEAEQSLAAITEQIEAKFGELRTMEGDKARIDREIGEAEKRREKIRAEIRRMAEA